MRAGDRSCLSYNLQVFNRKDTKTCRYLKANRTLICWLLSRKTSFKGRLDKIIDTLYYARLIDLSIEGLWDADAVTDLQELLHVKSKEKPDLLFYLLSTYPDEKVYSFWYFYFNSLLPSKEGIPAYFTALKGKYPKIYQILEKAFKASDGQAVCR